MGALLSWATRGATLRHVRHVTPVHPAAASGLVGEVYRQVAAEFGMLAPPIVLHSPDPPRLAAAWTVLREALLADGLTTRLDREAVAAAVSAANSCPYCVDVHGSTLAGLGGRDAVDAAGPGGTRLRELTAWAGRPGAAAPFPPAQAPELIGTAVTFHYLNRMVNVFLPDSPLPPAVRGPARQVMGRMAARLLGALARGRVTPGGSAGLLPDAELPADLAWARGRPSVAAAFGAAAAAVDEAGQSLPAEVRDLVSAQAARLPDGGPGLHAQDWLDGAVSALAPEHRGMARLALLTVFASYRVTPAVVADAGLADDGALVRLTAWSSMTAARVLGARMHAAGRLDGAVGGPR
ncbi:carboxymuconolactone decarboxylase family protein [Catellatospora vulcania]|uniref:carboxymuconolactone decarboxylase family protein n=1 Tax=Catellatospora vulcania TaxID=1460450 RepID=UPI0012D3AF11|nr:carboxymuconolactone decarboxylase family protein [Catellatospora vulcania]